MGVLIHKIEKILNKRGGKKEKKYVDWVTELVCKHFEVSKKEATDYLQIFYITKEGKSNLKEIISLYGVEESMIKKLRL